MEDERLSLFLALTVHNELTMYEKGFASEITNTPTFVAIESSLQANLLRAIHLVSSMNAGEPSKGGKYQLEAELNRAKSVLTAHPVRSNWRPIDVEIDVGESEAILPKKIKARQVFEGYFGSKTVRDDKEWIHSSFK